MAEDARLDRIEKKLDNMAEAIVALARMEERMITLFKRMDSLDAEQGNQDKRLRSVESRVGNNGQMLRFGERIFWIVVTAGIAYAFNKMRGG